MSYTEAATTKMLAANCVCCGRQLVDSVSVEMGMGPECRKDIFPPAAPNRKEANALVYEAAVAAQSGAVQKVLEIAEKISELGFQVLAEKVSRRFKEGAVRVRRNADITITEEGDDLVVVTPYRRGEAEAFVRAWRGIPGRRYDRARKRNKVPKDQRSALWKLFKEFFPGKWGTGPKGAFRVPTEQKKRELKQMELDLG